MEKLEGSRSFEIESLNKFSSAIYKIINAESEGEIKEDLQVASRIMGFQTFNISLNKRNVEDFMTDPLLTSWSEEDISSYLDDGFLNIDPLLRHVAEDNAPLVWDQDYFNRRGPDDYAKMIAERDIAGGMSILLPSQEGRFSAVTYLSFAPRALDDQIVLNLARTTGHIAMARMTQLGLLSMHGAPGRDGLQSLSGRQMEILHWLAAGKSNNEIATILDLSRKQVDYHVGEILRKLGVSTRIQAAVAYASR